MAYKGDREPSESQSVSIPDDKGSDSFLAASKSEK